MLEIKYNPLETFESEALEQEAEESDGFVVKNFLYTTSKLLQVDDVLELEYDPDDPTNIRVLMSDPKWFGFAFMGIGCCICLGTAISTYILSRSKTARQIYGTASAVSNTINYFD